MNTESLASEKYSKELPVFIHDHSRKYNVKTVRFFRHYCPFGGEKEHI